MGERRRALITGITGQDGSFLAELLLSKGYLVYGLIRRASTFNTGRINHIYTDPHEDANLRLYYGDLSDSSGLRHVLEDCRPHEIYNLGAQSHVKVSFEQAEYTADVVATGTLRLLEYAFAGGNYEPVHFLEALAIVGAKAVPTVKLLVVSVPVRTAFGQIPGKDVIGGGTHAV